MREYIATVTTPSGGTETVTVRAYTREGAINKLLKMGYVKVSNLTP